MPESQLPDFRGNRSRRRTANRDNLRAGCFVGIGLGAFALMLTLALVFAPTVSQVDLAEPQKVAARQALDLAASRADALHEAAQAGQAHEEEIALSEDAVNLMLMERSNAASRLAEHGLSDPVVRIADGRMSASARRAVGAMRVTLTVSLKPRMAPNGQVRFDVSGLALGRLSIPASLAQKLADEIAETLQSRAAKSGLEVTAATVKGHDLQLRARTRVGGGATAN